jgi:hypothetical protein
MAQTKCDTPLSSLMDNYKSKGDDSKRSLNALLGS